MGDEHAHEVDVAELTLIGAGGTRDVYIHPRFPGLVLKVFRNDPGIHYWRALFDTKDFAGFLAADVEPATLVLREGNVSSTKRALLQPRCERIEAGFSVSVSYWELQTTFNPEAGLSRSAVLQTFFATEPVAELMARACVVSRNFRRRLTALYVGIGNYLARTGYIVDFVGPLNVFLHPQNDEFGLEAIDLIKGDTIQPLNLEGGNDGTRLATNILNACAFVRMIWFIEHLIGAREISSLIGKSVDDLDRHLRSRASEAAFERLRQAVS